MIENLKLLEMKAMLENKEMCKTSKRNNLKLVRNEEKAATK